MISLLPCAGEVQFAATMSFVAARLRIRNSPTWGSRRGVDSRDKQLPGRAGRIGTPPGCLDGERPPRVLRFCCWINYPLFYQRFYDPSYQPSPRCSTICSISTTGCPDEEGRAGVQCPRWGERDGYPRLEPVHKIPTQRRLVLLILTRTVVATYISDSLVKLNTPTICGCLSGMPA